MSYNSFHFDTFHLYPFQVLASPGTGQDVRMTSSVQPPPIYQPPPPLVPPTSPRKADARWAFPPSVHRFVDTHYGPDALAMPLVGMFKLMNKTQF